MATTPRSKEITTAAEKPAVVGVGAIVVLMAGMFAAWLAAGSTGLLAHPLRVALTWVAMGVAIVAGWPRRGRSAGACFAVVVGVILGLIMTSTADPVVGALAVAMVLSALALCHQGLSARVILLAALAAFVLAVFRLACTSIPTVWHVANGIGWTLGTAAGGVTGEPLSIGATFGGVDFLVLMAALYTGWLIFTSPPRTNRAIYAAVAILAAQFAYLLALAYSEKLRALLPNLVLPERSDKDRMGIWTLGNALRTALPWNLPLLAAIAQAAVAAVMFRRAAWLPVADANALGRQQTASQRAGPPVVPRKMSPGLDALIRFGPMVLAAVIPVLIVLQWSTSADLQDKTILVYDRGPIDWHKPQYGRADPPSSRMFGMLPVFVESLGGTLVKSRELSAEELDKADVLLLLHPEEPLPPDRLERVWDFVRAGGSLLVAAAPSLQEGETQAAVNEVLEPTAMEVGDEAAKSAVDHWEHCCEVLAHPVTAGIDDWRNRFGLAVGSPVRTHWPARPILAGRFAFEAGRFAWSDRGTSDRPPRGTDYVPGMRLGDLVLAAEQPYEAGRIVVLGDIGPLTDDGNVAAYEFTGRLLGYLANKTGSPQEAWRQLLGLLAVASLVVLLAWRPLAWQVGITSVVLSGMLVYCAGVSARAGRVLPDGRKQSPNSVAYIDASHLEAYSSSPRDFYADPARGYDYGLGNFARTLMRNGYLPLLAPDLSAERLERAGLLVSVAPARPFSTGEQTAIRQFVEAGGTLLCMAGAEDADVTNELLDDFHEHDRVFQINIPRSPVATTAKDREPEPLGQANLYVFAQEDADKTKGQAKQPGKQSGEDSNQGDTRPPGVNVHFFAAWPVQHGEVNRWAFSDPLTRSEEGEPLMRALPHERLSKGNSTEDAKEGPKQQHMVTEDRSVVVSRGVGDGHVVVIADTYFAINWNLPLPSKTGEPADNDLFWRWLLSRVTQRRDPWMPPPATGKPQEPIERDQPIEPDSEGMEP